MPNYVRLKLPPGVFGNGTEYQANGRWYRSNLVRWSEGAMQPIGGWVKVQDSDDANLDLTKPVRGLLGWRSNAQAAYLAAGTATNAYGFAGGVLTDITPDNYTSGEEGSSSTAGNYGDGTYGLGIYNEGSDGGIGLTTEANSWQFDNFGEYLVANAYSDGRLLVWDLGDTMDNLETVSALAPTSCRGLVVTPERFLVGLAADGDSRKVQWSDQEDYTAWTASSTNQAGSYTLPGAGEIKCGRRMPNETLIFTDRDTFAMRYIAGTLIYSFKQVGSNTGIISRRAVATVDGRAYWMGHRGFFIYDGAARALPCSISDAIFSDINGVEASRIAGWSVSEYDEIWWSYPSAGSNEVDKVVCYNRKENHWSGPWDLERTDGIDRSAFGFPIAADASGGVYYHERGSTYLDPDDAALTPSAESGPFEIGEGDRLMTVNRYVPDENTVGDVDMTLLTRMYPTSSETETSVTVGSLSDVRVTGRQVRLKIEQDQVNWRFGIPRLEVVPRGRR